MNCRISYFILATLFFISSPAWLSAQHQMAEKTAPMVVRKDISFIVRKADKAKNIAIRFHTPFKTLAKLNHPLHRSDVMYAGKKLVIPVWMKRKDQATSSDFNVADYEVSMDSLDIYIREDFVCVPEIESDSLRKAAIDREIKRMDKKVAAINQEMDSIEEDGMRNLSKKEIRKMPMERARRAGKFEIGKQIDSITAQRKKISEERSKIDLRLADYDYLIENADYMSRHTQVEETRLIQIYEGDDAKKKQEKTSKK